MIRATSYRTLLGDTRLTLAELTRLSGVSLNTLRSLSSGRNRAPRPSTRRKLAAALRQHSATLSTLADTLDTLAIRQVERIIALPEGTPDGWRGAMGAYSPTVNTLPERTIRNIRDAV